MILLRTIAIAGIMLAAITSDNAGDHRRAVSVDQAAADAGRSRNAQAEQITTARGHDEVTQITPAHRSGDVAQLPGDAVEKPGRVPETSAEGGDAPLPSSPSDAARTEILRAWQAIRSRGQTPTPELIAREIGPETISQLFGAGGLTEQAVHSATGADDPTQKIGVPNGVGVGSGVTIVPGTSIVLPDARSGQ